MRVLSIIIICIVSTGTSVVSLLLDSRLCHHCSQVRSMADCTTTVSCSVDQDCYVHNNRSSNTASFSSGCMLRSTCSFLTIDDPNGNCLQCCGNDMCGGELCKTHKVPACVDDQNIDCSAIALQVCGRDDHFTYLLCRKTCTGCAGPRFTIPPVVLPTEPIVTPSLSECYYHGQSSAYDGFVNVTVMGEPCEDWQKYQHIFGYTSSMFPDSTVPAAMNYCRDPDHSGFPYCHTALGIHSCPVHQCPGRCGDNPHTDCRVIGAAICSDPHVSRHLCPVTCNVCDFGFVPEVTPIPAAGSGGTTSATSG